MNMIINNNDTLLFQGDSVTAAGGYVGYIRDMLKQKNPGLALTILNRGISGNKVSDLVKRWDGDCMALNPDIVTILIGINDTWHRFKHNAGHVTNDMFYNSYAEILTKTKKQTDKIILMEPFLLPVQNEMHGWREDLDGKIQTVRRLAVEFKTLYVPLDGLFAAAYARDGMVKYAEDGVHPSDDGCKLIAKSWLNILT